MSVSITMSIPETGQHDPDPIVWILFIILVLSFMMIMASIL